MRQHAAMRGSVGQIVEKRYLENFISGKSEVQDVLHYDSAAKLLTVEDPQFVFYIRNIGWKSFARSIGFNNFTSENKYDFALSFAGSDRDIAEALFNRLRDEEIEVFYDKNEQHRILAEDIEEYLRPIYQSEAELVVCILGPEYPKRIWTRIESEAFRVRFANGEVIPIWLDTAALGAFDESRRVGGVEFSRKEPLNDQVADIASLLVRKLRERREESKSPVSNSRVPAA
jgi:hypothetical protein